ncbi:phosphoribosylglycinamide formyltransferase [Sphingosinicella sp. BN140058]|uniref:phosphoribosylglycinamide formyltransferase n=1 Tax=Sphingosinicella sp. BN140058 TaxID=1892855 RepID=UPI0010117FE0|nr:phosphoribosylglycinamide formyltransferase [Sphingosinicella sp. BN140058]QAY79234.1 phosphoribosylglycinamide formyltransferase [Sphingosinicella sp. BN140058]
MAEPDGPAQAGRVRVGVLLSGRGTNMAALSEYRRRQERSYDLVLAASNVPEARGLVVARTLGIKTWAKSHKGIAREEFDALLDAELRKHGVELIALAGYMRLLSPGFIRSWQGRIVNIHPSLLPLYKGLDTHARALAAGDQWAGCSVHIVTEALDDGPVLAQAKVKIRERDTAETLAARVLEEEHKLYPQALDAFAARFRDGLAPEADLA